MSSVATSLARVYDFVTRAPRNYFFPPRQNTSGYGTQNDVIAWSMQFLQPVDICNAGLACKQWQTASRRALAWHALQGVEVPAEVKSRALALVRAERSEEWATNVVPAIAGVVVGGATVFFLPTLGLSYALAGCLAAPTGGVVWWRMHKNAQEVDAQEIAHLATGGQVGGGKRSQHQAQIDMQAIQYNAYRARHRTRKVEEKQQ